MSSVFGVIVCIFTFICIRAVSVDLKKDWDKVLVQTILVAVLYLLVDAILFSF